MAMTEDLTVFFDTDEFAVAATLDGVTVQVIFDRGYMQAFTGVASTDPQAMLPSSSASTATNASILVVAGNTYRVKSVQPDGTGITLLQLELQ